MKAGRITNTETAVPVTSIEDYTAAASLFADMHGFPSKAAEHWRYSATRLAAAKKKEDSTHTTGRFTTLPPLPYDAGECLMPDAPEEGFIVSVPTEIHRAGQGGFLDGAHAGHIAAAGKGTALDITASSQKPLLITRGSQALSTVYLTLRKNVSAILIERITPDAGAAYRSAFTYITLEQGASLIHYTIVDTGEGVSRYDSMRIVQQADSSYHNITCIVGDGGAFKRDVDTLLIEEGASNNQHLVNAAAGNALCDHYLPVQHIAPHCNSHQRVRCAPSDHATCIYYGRASAGQEAVGTEAHQLNKNLVLSPTAKIYSRPELDILTNEIICSHGSATGGIDEEALYYLQARGIPREQAITLMTSAFLHINEEAAPDSVLRDYMNKMIAGSPR